MARLEAILGVLKRSVVVSERRGALVGRLDGLLMLALGAPGSIRERPGAHGSSGESARAPENPRESLGKPGSGPLKTFQPLYLSGLQGCMSLGALHYVLKARWRIFF